MHGLPASSGGFRDFLAEDMLSTGVSSRHGDGTSLLYQIRIRLRISAMKKAPANADALYDVFHWFVAIEHQAVQANL